MDGFHPKVPLDLSDECCERVFKLLHKVEMRGDMANQCKYHSFLPHSPKYHYRATHSAGAHAYQVVEVATSSACDGVTEYMRHIT